MSKQKKLPNGFGKRKVTEGNLKLLAQVEELDRREFSTDPKVWEEAFSDVEEFADLDPKAYTMELVMAWITGPIMG